MHEEIGVYPACQKHACGRSAVGTYVEAELAQRVDASAVLGHLQPTLVLARVELHHHLPPTIAFVNSSFIRFRLSPLTLEPRLTASLYLPC